jgi:kynurenine formamidase
MKLLSPAEFVYKNGHFYYLDRQMHATQVNVKSRLTLIFPNHKAVLSEGIYSLEDLKKKAVQ